MGNEAFRAVVPMPVQVVIDDVGWWSGEDGSERNEPYRTGVAREHVPEDYQAIVLLGRTLGIRPQAAMVLCEWDRENILRELLSSTWMGSAWDNPFRHDARLERAAQILRDNAVHIELTLHGLGHEFWRDGRMERAEWHDTEGRMRPRDEVERHIECYSRILDQHGFAPFPDSFVPTAFLHRFGAANGLAGILRKAGVRLISTPFSTMFRDRGTEEELYGMDAGVLTVDRGHDLCPWYAIGPCPGGLVEGPICGMHWPNLLHQDPARNHEVVERWVDILSKTASRLDRTLAPDARAFAEQLICHLHASVETREDEVIVDVAAVTKALPPHCRRVFRVRTACPSDQEVVAEGADVCSAVRPVRNDEAILELCLEPLEDRQTIRLSRQSAQR